MFEKTTPIFDLESKKKEKGSTIGSFVVDKQTLKLIKTAMNGLRNKSLNSVFFDPSDNVDKIEQADIQKVLDVVSKAYDTLTE
jgi:hypothetical protein